MEKRETNVLPEVDAVESISIVPVILDIIHNVTGLGFAVVANVTSERWIACAVRDAINFGIGPGEELKLETTISNEVRQSGKPVAIDNVDEDKFYRNHHTPAIYAFQSYIAVPITLYDGSFFGILGAIDPKPAMVNTPEVKGLFKVYADLVAFHIHETSGMPGKRINSAMQRLVTTLREQLLAMGHHPLDGNSATGSRPNDGQFKRRCAQFEPLLRRHIDDLNELIDNLTTSN